MSYNTWDIKEKYKMPFFGNSSFQSKVFLYFCFMS
jgi:hypothetical protein